MGKREEMSTTADRNWAQALRTAFGSDTAAVHRVKPKRHDHQHRMRYLDDSRMRREMGHL